MQRQIIVDISSSFMPDEAQLRDLLSQMHERYSGDPIDDPEWLHERGHSYGHIRTFRIGLHCDNAGGRTGQESIAYVCDLLLNRSTWIHDRSEMSDLIAETNAIYTAIGIIASEQGHDMTYGQSVCYDTQPRSARLRPIEDPVGPLIDERIMSSLTDDLPSLNYLVDERGNRKHNLRFDSSEPSYIPRVQSSDIPALDRITEALSCFEPIRRMGLIAQCQHLLETTGRPAT